LPVSADGQSEGFEAVSEAERIDKKVIEGNAALPFTSHPLRETAESVKAVQGVEGRSGSVDILTYFFTEDSSWLRTTWNRPEIP
jgi:hypothetical protein